jgi:hypothetical protein
MKTPGNRARLTLIELLVVILPGLERIIKGKPNHRRNSCESKHHYYHAERAVLAFPNDANTRCQFQLSWMVI